MRNGLLEMTIGFLRLGGPFKAGRTVLWHANIKHTNDDDNDGYKSLDFYGYPSTNLIYMHMLLYTYQM